MFWPDELTEEISKRFAAKIGAKKPLVIRDEKTLSGRVHIGSLRGIVIHGLMAQTLAEKGIAGKFLFELNDFDPMDGLPVYVDEKTYRPHMGKPLCMVPPHEPGHENYPAVFSDELKEAVEPLGLPISYYTLKPMYESGRFNDCIKDALDNADKIRRIYLEVSGGGKPADWYPLSVICGKCGKIGTTQVTGWSGKEVTYTCKPDYVAWAKGCGYEGRISPFGGNAKLPWKVEWPAKWKVLGVDIEGAGKDHYAAGGSREIGAKISEEVFNYSAPFDIPYEMFNFKGRKMSASKGIGASSKEVSDMLPPKLLKLLMIRKKPNVPIDFDPKGSTIPDLFDEYDRLADHYFKRHPEPYGDFARIFQLAQVNPKTKIPDLWQMRFSSMSFTIQMPHLNLEDEARKLKGSDLTKAEKSELNERGEFVRKWLREYAPDEYRFTILNKAPSDLTLDDKQKNAMMILREVLSDESLEWEGAKIHESIHKVKEENGMEPKKIFQPIYRMFLGKDRGPQVGWFLSTFSRDDVLRRLDDAVRQSAAIPSL